MKNRYIKLFSCALAIAISGAAQAIEIEGDSSGIDFTDAPSSSISLTVRGPAGFLLETEYFYVDADTGLVDGTYHYEILGELEVAAAPIISNGSDGRGAGSVPTEIPTGVIETGYFILAEGELLEEPSE